MALTLYSQSYFDMFRGLFPDTVYCTLYGWCANYTDYSRRVHVWWLCRVCVTCLKQGSHDMLACKLNRCRHAWRAPFTSYSTCRL